MHFEFKLFEVSLELVKQGQKYVVSYLWLLYNGQGDLSAFPFINYFWLGPEDSELTEITNCNYNLFSLKTIITVFLKLYLPLQIMSTLLHCCSYEGCSGIQVEEIYSLDEASLEDLRYCSLILS